MMTNWASPEHKLRYAALIDDIDRQAGGLAALAGPAQIEAVRAYDAAAFAHVRTRAITSSRSWS